MGSNRTEMRIIISLVVFTGIVVAIALGLMRWNMQLVDEYKNTFADFMLPVYALPTFESFQNRNLVPYG